MEMKMKVIYKFKEKVLLGENARLFDTKEYLLKTFIAVLMAAYIGSKFDYVSKDMISLLFGMMLTLEPVNMSGIRSGISQIEATLIGAIITGIVLSILGYGILSTAIGITLTLYVCMMINWRELMVVAVFTAIYMTQFVQLDALGQGSSIETTKLRLAALGTGLAIAFLVNFLFSLIGYKRLVNKRIYYISKEVYDVSFQLKTALEEKNSIEVSRVMAKMPPLFITIDWISSTLSDVKKDQERFKIVYRHFDADQFLNYSIGLRSIAHVIYDLCYRIDIEADQYMSDGFIDAYKERLLYFEKVKEAFNNHSDIPVMKWATESYPWINHYSKALEKISR
jgi:hypothetical protein